MSRDCDTCDKYDDVLEGLRFRLLEAADEAYTEADVDGDGTSQEVLVYDGALLYLMTSAETDDGWDKLCQEVLQEVEDRRGGC